MINVQGGKPYIKRRWRNKFMTVPRPSAMIYMANKTEALTRSIGAEGPLRRDDARQ